MTAPSKGQRLIDYVRFIALPRDHPDKIMINERLDGIRETYHDCTAEEYLALLMHYIFYMEDLEFNKALELPNE